MFHGNGDLDKAINVLNKNDKFQKFRQFGKSYNQGNMFICSQKLMNDYYETIFDWLIKCEEIFGFKLDSYGKVRIYGFCERFLPFGLIKILDV